LTPNGSRPSVFKRLLEDDLVDYIAMGWEYLQSFKKWPAALPEREQSSFLTPEQIQDLLAEIDDKEFPDFCMCSAYTGLRSGEIFRVKWGDIDTPVEGLRRAVSAQKNRSESYIPISANARGILDVRAEQWAEGLPVQHFEPGLPKIQGACEGCGHRPCQIS
jgi:integrase